MKSNFIQIKFKDKNYNNLNNKKILILFRLSIGNGLINLKYPFKSNKNIFGETFVYEKSSNSRYNKNGKKYPVQNLEIINKNKFIKTNNAKMEYKISENIKEKKIINKIFISINMKRSKVVINNK